MPIRRSGRIYHRNKTMRTTTTFGLVARIAVAVAIAVLAIIFLSSWLVALVIGGLTIVAVAVDGWNMSRTSHEHVAMDPNPTPVERLSVDLRRRR